MVHNRGGNILIWTVFWLFLVVSVLPPFINVSAMIVAQQQVVDDAQSALQAAVQRDPHAPWIAGRQFQLLLDEELPHTSIQVLSFVDHPQAARARILITMPLPVPVAGWSTWQTELTIQT
ncbi:hypothetical protein [Sulfobacillus thermosulfidooxidans]|uniref:hypothetical protein n=1 Tax=Sulfobacillus thermosulfidooxidans TaxID=28034 RepID=UPI0006B456CC|nr:hypothetical protein [Sulfobacillus thermosulfidooxidans]